MSRDRVAPRLIVAGTSSGVGKTTVTLAVLAALQRRGRRVQAFKVGPDFIDPGHHAAITGRPSRNLDGWMLGRDRNLAVFCRAAQDADVSIIEGMMGLFDGSSSTSEVGSTGEIAKQLTAPVLLVIDGSAMARSAAAMALGYAQFDRHVHVAGVIFNRISGEGHYRLLKEAVESTSQLAVVGYLKPDATVSIGDRHLGLVTAIEHGGTDLYDRLGEAAAPTIDLERIYALAQSAPPLACPSLAMADGERARAEGLPIRIGVAHDPAFCFYYPDNLELLKSEGAEIISFSPLRDRSLPPVDLLYLGGGYPELYGERLASNRSMREAIAAFSRAGGPIYAECGGLMYLTQAIRDVDGRRYDMVGIFPAEAVMDRRRMTIGYRELEVTRPGVLGDPGTVIRGHEFHYSSLVWHGTVEHAGRLFDAGGQPRAHDGLMVDNTVALYTHLHFASQPSVARALVRAARNAAVTGEARP